jgi:hypothetical protein
MQTVAKKANDKAYAETKGLRNTRLVDKLLSQPMNHRTHHTMINKGAGGTPILKPDSFSPHFTKKDLMPQTVKFAHPNNLQ